MEPTEKNEYVEVYETDSAIAARKVLDVVLAPEGIEGIVHDRKEAAFPSIGKPGGIYIAVPRSQRERAVQLLDEAKENGFLDAKEGERL